MVATEFRHLPFPGALVNQPEWFMADLFTLSWRKAVLKEQLQSPSAMGMLAKPRVAFG